MAKRGRRGSKLLAAGLVASGACSTQGDSASVQRADRPSITPTNDVGTTAGAPAPPIFSNPQPAQPPPPTFGDPAAQVGSPPPPPEPPPDDLLGAQAVHRSMPAARVLYSWTTDEQFQQLRDDPVLLTRSERPGVGGGLIRSVLADLAALGDPLSQALTAPEFEKARYAWPNPWATLLGWPDESYGDRLIRIELREEAWVMTLHAPSSGDVSWQVFDMQGEPVTRREAISDPQRIGAIFHLHEPSEGFICSGSFVPETAGAFREYFLPNEAMVERWSLETEEMRARLVDDIALLTEYRDAVAAGRGLPGWYPFATQVACLWFQDEPMPGALGQEGASDNYLRALAMASPFYEPSAANLDALIAALEDALFEPDPFVHEP